MAKLTKEQLREYLGEEEAKKYYKDLEIYNQRDKIFYSAHNVKDIWYSPLVWGVKHRIWGYPLLQFIVLSVFCLYPFVIRPAIEYLWFNPWYALPHTLFLLWAYIGGIYTSSYALFEHIRGKIEAGVTKELPLSTNTLEIVRFLFALPVVFLIGSTIHHYVQQTEHIAPFNQASYDAFEKAIDELERPNPLQVLATGYRQPPKRVKPKKVKKKGEYVHLIDRIFPETEEPQTPQEPEYDEVDLPYDFVLQKGVKRNFVDNQDETITDKSLGLMWQDDKKFELYEYEGVSAEGACRVLKLGGYNDWRVPTIYELISLIRFNQDNSDMPFKFGYKEHYIKLWSSTKAEHDKKLQAFIRFGDNITLSIGWGSRNAEHYVRCVRSLKKQKPIKRFDFIEDAHRQIVLDRGTSLMWQNEPYTKIEGRVKVYNRQTHSKKEVGKVLKIEHALEYCEALELGGYDDWYLPNIFQVLQAHRHFEYPLKKSLFTPLPHNREHDCISYRSSTNYANSTPKFVRCVRDAKVWKWDEE